MWQKTLTVLGAPNSDTGELSTEARDRCQRALRFYTEHPDSKIILTGGFGPHFNRTAHPHTYYTKRYLCGLGVPESAIVEELDSVNTNEDLVMLHRCLTINGDPAGVHTIITSNFHVERVTLIAAKLFKEFTPKIIGAVDTLTPEALESAERHERRAIMELKARIGE